MTEPEYADLDEIKISVPKALPVLSEEKAQELAPNKTESTELASQAQNMMTRIEDIDPNSPEFQEKIAAITSLGKTDALTSAKVSNDILSRPTLTKSPSGKKVTDSLNDLRATITELDPNRADLKGVKKSLKVLNKVYGGKQIERYIHKFETNQAKLDAIVASLESGQYDLKADNNSIHAEQARLWDSMASLRDAGSVLDMFDQSLQTRIDELNKNGERDKAESLNAHALFPVRQRRQDVATELAVATQGYMSLGLLLENNDQLINGVERARTTTLAALYTSLIVSQALDRQKNVLDQLNAIRDTTSNMIESTSKQMRDQGAEINNKASEAMVDVQKLQTAYDNIFATMDAVDNYKIAASENMKATVASLEAQINRAKDRLEQTHTQIENRDKANNYQINYRITK